MAYTYRMTRICIDLDKPKNKQQKKSLTQGGPAQLDRNMPQKEYIFSDRGASKVHGMLLESHKHQESKVGQTS